MDCFRVEWHRFSTWFSQPLSTHRTQTGFVCNYHNLHKLSHRPHSIWGHFQAEVEHCDRAAETGGGPNGEIHKLSVQNKVGVLCKNVNPNIIQWFANPFHSLFNLTLHKDKICHLQTDKLYWFFANVHTLWIWCVQTVGTGPRKDWESLTRLTGNGNGYKRLSRS